VGVYNGHGYCTVPTRECPFNNSHARMLPIFVVALFVVVRGVAGRLVSPECHVCLYAPCAISNTTTLSLGDTGSHVVTLPPQWQVVEVATPRMPPILGAESARVQRTWVVVTYANGTGWTREGLPSVDSVLSASTQWLLAHAAPGARDEDVVIERDVPTLGNRTVAAIEACAHWSAHGGVPYCTGVWLGAVGTVATAGPWASTWDGDTPTVVVSVMQEWWFGIPGDIVTTEGNRGVPMVLFASPMPGGTSAPIVAGGLPGTFNDSLSAEIAAVAGLLPRATFVGLCVGRVRCGDLMPVDAAGRVATRCVPARGRYTVSTACTCFKPEPRVDPPVTAACSAFVATRTNDTVYNPVTVAVAVLVTVHAGSIGDDAKSLSLPEVPVDVRADLMQQVQMVVGAAPGTSAEAAIPVTWHVFGPSNATMIADTEEVLRSAVRVACRGEPVTRCSEVTMGIPIMVLNEVAATGMLYATVITPIAVHTTDGTSMLATPVTPRWSSTMFNASWVEANPPYGWQAVLPIVGTTPQTTWRSLSPVWYALANGGTRLSVRAATPCVGSGDEAVTLLTSSAVPTRSSPSARVQGVCTAGAGFSMINTTNVAPSAQVSWVVLGTEPLGDTGTAPLFTVALVQRTAALRVSGVWTDEAALALAVATASRRLQDTTPRRRFGWVNGAYGWAEQRVDVVVDLDASRVGGLDANAAMASLIDDNVRGQRRDAAIGAVSALWWAPLVTERVVWSGGASMSAAVVIVGVWAIPATGRPTPRGPATVPQSLVTQSGVAVGPDAAPPLASVNVTTLGSTSQSAGFASFPAARTVTTGVAWVCKAAIAGCGPLVRVRGSDAAFYRFFGDAPNGIPVVDDLDVGWLRTGCEFPRQGSRWAPVGMEVPPCLCEEHPWFTQGPMWDNRTATTAFIESEFYTLLVPSTPVGKNGVVVDDVTGRAAATTSAAFATDIGLPCANVTCATVEGGFLSEPCTCSCGGTRATITLANGNVACGVCVPTAVPGPNGTCVPCSMSGCRMQSTAAALATEDGTCSCVCLDGWQGPACDTCTPVGNVSMVVHPVTHVCVPSEQLCGSFGSWDPATAQCVCTQMRTGALCDVVNTTAVSTICPEGYVAGDASAPTWCVCSNATLRHPWSGVCTLCVWPALFDDAGGGCVADVSVCPQTLTHSGVDVVTSMLTGRCTCTGGSIACASSGCGPGLVDVDGTCVQCATVCGNAYAVCANRTEDCVCNAAAESTVPPCVAAVCSDTWRLDGVCQTCPALCITTGGVCGTNGTCVCPVGTGFDVAVGCGVCPVGTRHTEVGCTSCDACVAGQGRCQADGTCRCVDGFDPTTGCSSCQPTHALVVDDSNGRQVCVPCDGTGLRCGAHGVCVLLEESREFGCECAQGTVNVCEGPWGRAATSGDCCVPCLVPETCYRDAQCDNTCDTDTQQCVRTWDETFNAFKCACRAGMVPSRDIDGACVYPTSVYPWRLWHVVCDVSGLEAEQAQFNAATLFTMVSALVASMATVVLAVSWTWPTPRVVSATA
jgi:hypothetical protein